MARAKKVRNANEFNTAQLQLALRHPTGSVAEIGGWSLARIRDARDQQLVGQFRLAAALATAMRTDDALFTAYENRLAPQRCIGVELVPASGRRGASVAAEAEALFGQNGVGVRTETLADINGCLANHGIAFGVNRWNPRDDGSRVDVEMHTWPIEHVRWFPQMRCFQATMFDGSLVPIVHGDGRWVIFTKHEIEPWTQEACVLPGALVWAAHAFAQLDWAKGSKSHGDAKFIGELPEGTSLMQTDGSLTAEALAMVDLLKDLAGGATQAGIRPAGSKVDLVTNTSTAWQVWSELALSREKAAARIYLGTDGTLGASGGAPGVDITQLFGVATTKVQGDLSCIERGLLTGVSEPWTAINFGDSSLAPFRRYLMPDSDANAERDAYAKRLANFHTAIEKLRANGFTVDQAIVDDLAKRFDVTAPQLPEKATSAPSITLAPTDIARVVTVNEARASAGLNALARPDGSPDPDGLLTVEQFAAKKAAEVAPRPTTPAPTNGAAKLPASA
jgi:hypothetical protein